MTTGGGGDILTQNTHPQELTEALVGTDWNNWDEPLGTAGKPHLDVGSDRRGQLHHCAFTFFKKDPLPV